MRKQVAWHNNDKLARQVIAEGHKHEREMAERLRRAGLAVSVGTQEVRASVSDAMRGDYVGTVDLVVEGWNVQVKSRRLRSWPDPLYLCSKRSWRHDRDSTGLWICVSQYSGDAICISGARARANAKVVSSCDNRRGIDSYQVVTVALDLWSPLEVAIEWLLDRRLGLPQQATP